MSEAGRVAGVGMLAGAAGTVMLQLVRGADAVTRGRASSDAPANLAGRVAAGAGLDLGAGPELAARLHGLGTLLGLLLGLVVGLGYGLLRVRGQRPRLPLAAVGVSMVSVVLAELPVIASGAAEPQQWGWPGWLAVLLAHLAYGVVTVVVFESLDAQPKPKKR